MTDFDKMKDDICDCIHKRATARFMTAVHKGEDPDLIAIINEETEEVMRMVKGIFDDAIKDIENRRKDRETE